MYRDKCLQYYLDSRIYTAEQVQQSIEKTKKEFPNKQAKVKLALNDFGVYVITFEFRNKNNYLSKIIIRLKSKIRRNLLLSENNKIEKNKKQKVYGQYKNTGTYRPY